MIDDDRPIGEDDLHAYTDDRLGPGRRRRVEEWLTRNSEHHDALETDRRLRRAMRLGASEIVREPIPARLRLSDIRREVRRRRSRRLPAITASAAMLLLGVTTGWLGRGSIEPRVSAMEDAPAAYRVFARDPIRPVEVRADERVWLAQWLGQRVGRPLDIPDLSSLDLRFMGGRLLATEDGAAALLMYDDDRGSRVVLYVRPVDEPRPEGLLQRADEGLETHYWYDSGFGYAVTGPTEFRRLPIATEAVRRQFASA